MPPSVDRILSFCVASAIIAAARDSVISTKFQNHFVVKKFAASVQCALEFKFAGKFFYGGFMFLSATTVACWSPDVETLLVGFAGI